LVVYYLRDGIAIPLRRGIGIPLKKERNTSLDLDVEARVEVLESKVTPAMNQQLLSEFTIEEISGALNQMSFLKALGPDGFSACFCQHDWSMVYPEVCAAILSFLNSGNMDPCINATHIALIPKVATPGCVTDFRPIS
jgi:hypothetical protein